MLVLVAGQWLTPWALLVLLALPRARLAWRAFGAARPAERPAFFPRSLWPLWHSAIAFDHMRRYSILLVAGLLGNLLLSPLAGGMH